MSDHRVNILQHRAIHARLKRMAYEIYEANFSETEIIVIGIDERGGYLATELVQYLTDISPLTVQFVNASLDRSGGRGEIGIDLDMERVEELKDKAVVVVDDVLYTGITLLNVVAILLQVAPRKIQTAILIDRGHRSMPVSPDFVGVELATTLHQHVSMEINPNNGEVAAFLQ
ncbi:MAG: phosphoribosyltransferase family protein [Bacteroidota bacterium]